VYACAFGIQILLPLAYLVCQVLTWIVYEGRWRRRSLLPIPIVLFSCTPLLFVQNETVLTIVFLGAPAAGLVALATIWSGYVRSQEQAAEGGDAEA